MSEGPVDLHTKIQATRQRMLAALSDIGDRSAETNRVISGLRARLLNYLHVLSHFLDAAPNVRSDAEQRRLIASARLGVCRLEDRIDKLMTVADATAGNLEPEPSIRSLRSITHESMIYARSLYPDSASLFPFPLPADTDFSVVTDDRYLVGLLSCCLFSLAIRPRIAEVAISIEVVQTDDQISVKWYLSGRSTDQCDQIDGIGDHPALSSIDDYYLKIVGQMLSSSVTAVAGTDIEISSKLSLVREIGPCSMVSLSGPWIDKPILVIDPPPTGFTRLPGSIVQISDLSILDSNPRPDDPGLLILHHGNSSHSRIAQNLEACRRAHMPILLRASLLDYDHFVRFRDHVDSIVIEPSSPSLLARQVRGLIGTSDRRAIRRRAELF